MSANTASAQWPWPVFDPADLAKIGEKQAEAFNEAQRELSALIQETNEAWQSRAELERDMAGELTRKLSAAKTLPDVAGAYQEWIARHVELMAKDREKALANGQKFANAMSRLMPGNGPRPVS
jgi:hypothetical protein